MGIATAATTNTAASGGEPAISKHNIATFAGAVGGSVGVFLLLAIYLWYSIWSRRRKSRMRAKVLEDAERENARRFGLEEDYRGPIPFVPRYFPGTIPPSPPPYEGAPGGEARLGLPNGDATTTTTTSGPETSMAFSTPPVSIPSSLLNSPMVSLRRSSLISGVYGVPSSVMESDSEGSSMGVGQPFGLVAPIPVRPSSVLRHQIGEEAESSDPSSHYTAAADTDNSETPLRPNSTSRSEQERPRSGHSQQLRPDSEVDPHISGSASPAPAPPPSSPSPVEDTALLHERDR